MAKLKKRYNLIGGGNLQWFLGMEIIRNRYKGYVTLIQRVHFKRLRKNYGINTNPITPIIQKELLLYKRTATKLKVKRYQQKVGSLLYVAVTIRPDVAFAVSRLARFLINPGLLHYKVTDRVINYLASIKDLTLYFGGFNDLEVVSDASFADNTLDRKSS